MNLTQQLLEVELLPIKTSIFAHYMLDVPLRCAKTTVDYLQTQNQKVTFLVLITSLKKTLTLT